MTKELSFKLKAFSLFLMILVVFIHSENLVVNVSNSSIAASRLSFNYFIQDFISNGICRIAVPIFFIISGYLFYLRIEYTASGFINKYKSRFHSLFLPYLIWASYGIILYFLIQMIPSSRKFFTHLIVQYDIIDILDAIFLHPITHQLWFVRDLMILVLLSPLIGWLLKKVDLVIVFLFFISWMFGIKFFILNSESIFFFFLGAFLSINKVSLRWELLENNVLILLISWLLLLIVKTLLVLYNNNLQFVPYLLRFSIIIGILAVWGLYDKSFYQREYRLKRVEFLFQFSFFIYVFHEPLLTIFQKLMIYILGFSDVKLLVVYFCCVFITILTCVIVGKLLSKFLPKAYKIMTGNR